MWLSNGRWKRHSPFENRFRSFSEITIHIRQYYFIPERKIKLTEAFQRLSGFTFDKVNMKQYREDRSVYTYTPFTSLKCCPCPCVLKNQKYRKTSSRTKNNSKAIFLADEKQTRPKNLRCAIPTVPSRHIVEIVPSLSPLWNRNLQLSSCFTASFTWKNSRS